MMRGFRLRRIAQIVSLCLLLSAPPTRAQYSADNETENPEELDTADVRQETPATRADNTDEADNDESSVSDDPSFNEEPTSPPDTETRKAEDEDDEDTGDDGDNEEEDDEEEEELAEEEIP